MESKSFLNTLLDKHFIVGNLNTWQIEFLQTYQTNKAFQQLIAQKNLPDLPHYINYLILVEKEKRDINPEKTQESMHTFFQEILQQQTKNRLEANAIRQAFEEQNEWTKHFAPQGQKQLTTSKDIKTIDSYCQTLAKNAADADAMLISFFRHLIKAQVALHQPQFENDLSIAEIQLQHSDYWYSEPWYYIYVQYFGTPGSSLGNFESLTRMLDYLEQLEIKNIYILPHYQSPNGDAGYDISDYKPAEAYGGEEKFRSFMNEATQRGFRVATDLVFNHTSADHHWFKQALKGSSKYFNYFLKCPAAWQNIALSDILKDEDGDIYLYLPEINNENEAVTSKRILIFPDVDQTLWLKKEVEGLNEDILFYREFYPFQIDLDLQNPEVVDELFQFLGQEMSMGVLGKRTDAIAHWIKKPGTEAKDLPETHALQKLIKQFLKHVSSRAIVIPEVVTSSKKLKSYAGEPTFINGQITTTGGDALLDFQLQGMLREMLYFQKTDPFWSQVFERGEEGGNTSIPLVPIEHHDETYMGFIQELEPMRDYIQGSFEYYDDNEEKQIIRRGIIYKNGMSGGARYAECLNRDSQRIAMAQFCLYMMPGTPMIYYGSEIGAINNWLQMETRQKEQFETLKLLLGEEMVGEGKAITFNKCEDPRELQRGPIKADVFFNALENNYLPLKVIQTLNKLRKVKAALNSYYFSNVDTWDAGILGLIRYPAYPNKTQRPIVVLVNLTGRKLTAKIPVGQLQNKLASYHFTLRQILSLDNGQSSDQAISIRIQDFPLTTDFMYFPLNQYSALLLEVC